MATTVPFFTNLQCESALVWSDLIDHLENGMKNFSEGKVEQPVREMLTVDQHKGFFGKYVYNDMYSM